MASAEQITTANKTSRNSPAIGQKALTPKVARQYMENNFKKDDTLILDFGAGAAIENDYQAGKYWHTNSATTSTQRFTVSWQCKIRMTWYTHPTY